MTEEHQIVFRCTTCQFFDKCDKEISGFRIRQRQINYDSLSDANDHMIAEPGHNIVAVISISIEDPK